MYPKDLIKPLAAFVVAALALFPTLTHASQADDSGAGLKAAVERHVARQAPGVFIEHVEIARVVGDYATARVYADLEKNPTDIATVILRKQAGRWVGVGGPGTAFPQGERAGAPDKLFDFEDPYTWLNGQNAINRLNVERKEFKSQFARFEYPDGATIVPTDGAKRGLLITGPQIDTDMFHGPAYNITIVELGEQSSVDFDAWGYDRMLADIAVREAANGAGGTNTQPESAMFYGLERSLVFQVDWSGGDSTQRVFYVTPRGGGPVLQVETRVYPEANNPGAIEAWGAVNLVLHTLEQPAVNALEPSVGMPKSGSFDATSLLLVTAGFSAIAVGGGMVLRTRLKARSHN